MNKHNSRFLFDTVTRLTQDHQQMLYIEVSAHDFSDYFNDRVEAIRARIPQPSTGGSVFGATMPSYSGQGFSEFESISLDDLTKVVMASRPTTCSLDPLPAWVIKDRWSTLGAYVLSILNVSLLNGVFPPCFKCVVVKPLLKKTSLDPYSLASYRPV